MSSKVGASVAVHERDIARNAFASPEWRTAADALLQAAGVSVAVVDFATGESYSSVAMSCGACHVGSTNREAGLLGCFDSYPAPESSTGRMVCRSGLATLYKPVRRDGRIVAHVIIGGFVTSTRERRGLYEAMLTRSGNQDAARKAVKTLPVIARRQADAYLQMVLASAQTIFDATAERTAAAERIEELRLFVTAGHQVVSTERLDAGALAAIADEAVALIGGEAGAVLRPHGSSLEVVAVTEGWRGAVGALVPRTSTASGRAVETRRTVVAPGQGGSSTLAMPLVLSHRVLGVLEVRLPSSALPLPQDRVARLGRFGQFMAIAVEREDERAAVERAMAGYAQLNELATALGGRSDVNSVAELITSVIDKSFTFELAGLVLTGWGRDRADVVVRGTVAATGPDTVLGIVSGREAEHDPYEEMRFVTHQGALEEIDEPQDWSVAISELRYGDLDVGYLFLARSDGIHYGAQDHALLEGISAHASAAFGRSALFSRVRDEYAKTIAALSATLDYGERTVAGHAGRVMEYAMAVGASMGLGVEAVEHLRFAGLLHDVGKGGVPEEILLKPTCLTPEEFERAKAHVEIGAEIVDQIDFLKALTPIILHHHERWDGTGYPHGLKGEEIPLLARILCVADSFDAMTTQRSYAKKLTLKKARDEITRASGTQFDPRVVEALLGVLDRMAVAGGTGLLADVGYERPDLLA